MQSDRGRGVQAAGLHWGGVAIAVLAALVIGGASGLLGRFLLNASNPRPLLGVTAQPFPAVGQRSGATPSSLPDHTLLQVPFTTQAPLGDWAQHQESCEAANLIMVWRYWSGDPWLVIAPQDADSYIQMIDGWKPQQDLNDTMMGELAQQHWGYGYRILPNTQQVIAEQLAAGRPLLAEVRTHGLGNGHYPGYYNHYEETGWSVPHFVTIIGYDSSGVWLNDPGITMGRGYHISYAQLAHAIDDLDQHHPSLAQGQVLLLIAPPDRAGAVHNRPGTA